MIMIRKKLRNTISKKSYQRHKRGRMAMLNTKSQRENMAI